MSSVFRIMRGNKGRGNKMIKLEYVDRDGTLKRFDAFVQYQRNAYGEPLRYPLACVQVTIEDAEQVAAIGGAFLMPGDNFNKAIGRKIAFRRAIEALTFDYSAKDARAVRSQLWHCYLNHKASPESNPPRVE
jgi:hypothetical protein